MVNRNNNVNKEFVFLLLFVKFIEHKINSKKIKKWKNKLENIEVYKIQWKCIQFYGLTFSVRKGGRKRERGKTAVCKWTKIHVEILEVDRNIQIRQTQVDQHWNHWPNSTNRTRHWWA